MSNNLVLFLSISEEEINDLSLLHLSSSSMKELVSFDADDTIIKKPTTMVLKQYSKEKTACSHNE